MPRYAAIDIGSNSTRLAVAEAGESRSTKLLAVDREVTRLGTSVFSSGEISPEAMDTVARTLQRFAAVYRRLNVSAVRAVATSAVRDARNQQDFLRRASEAAGTQVELISGLEESRLIHVGVQSVWPHPDKRLMIIDIGGGSAEVIVSESGRLEAAVSKPLGAVRLTELFLKADPPAASDIERMNAYVDEKIAAIQKRTGAGDFHRAIATSATAAAVICAIQKVPRRERDRADRLRASTAEIGKLLAVLQTRNLEQRRRVSGIGPRRAEIILAGITVLHRTLRAFDRSTVFYSMAGVRDGILADLAERGGGLDLTRLSKDQRQAVESMAKRFGVDVRHARKTAQMAHSLFAGLQPLHALPPSAGKLLEAAAYLIDTGHYVSGMAHHKHSFYLVANGDLPAFTSEERLIIALLCRFHRKSMPSARHGFFQDLTAASKKLVLSLVPMLRLADGLDRSHDQRVEDVSVSLGTGGVTLELASGADTNLEIWAGERVVEVFRQVYGKDLRLARAKERERLKEDGSDGARQSVSQ